VRRLLHAATLAPDHKLQRPWRFVAVKGEAREQFGNAHAQAAKERDPTLAPDAEAKLRGKPLRAPFLFFLIASPKPGSKVPLWEQHASMAAAAQNLCLAATAMGLGTAWKSSSLCDLGPVRRLFRMAPHESCFGWIDVGHVPQDAQNRLAAMHRPAVALSDVASELSSDGTLRGL
jgi:nitroreductase